MGVTSKLLYMCGFEGDHIKQGAELIAGGAIVTTGSRTGTYGKECVYNADHTSDTFHGDAGTTGRSVSKVGVSFSLYISSINASDSFHLSRIATAIENLWFLGLRNTGGNNKLSIIQNSDGAGNSTDYAWTSTANLAVTTIYVIEYYTYNTTNASSKIWPVRVKLYSNAGALLDDSGWVHPVQTSGGLLQCSQVKWGPAGLGQDIFSGDTIVIDDLIVTEGPPPRGAKILGMFPNAAGSETQWGLDYSPTVTCTRDIPTNANTAYGTMTTNEALDISETGVDVTGTGTVEVGDCIVVETEIMLVTAVAATLTVVRGINGTAATHTTGQTVYQAGFYFSYTSAGDPFTVADVISIENEKMTVSFIDTTNNVLLVTRGSAGTTPGAHTTDGLPIINHTTAATYALLDEVPPAADYAFSTGAFNHLSNAAASGLTLTAQDRSAAHNIIGLAIWLSGIRSGGTTISTATRYKTSGSAAGNGGRQIVFSTTITYGNQIYRVSPTSSNEWTATGGAETDIDALEFGAGALTKIGVAKWQLDQTFLEIAYGPDFNPASGCTLTTALTELLTSTVVVYTGADVFNVGDIIEIDQEWMVITAIVTATNTLTVTRGKWTTPQRHQAGAVIRISPWIFHQRGAG